MGKMDPDLDPEHFFLQFFVNIFPLASAYFFRSGSRKPDPDSKTGYLKRTRLGKSSFQNKNIFFEKKKTEAECTFLEIVKKYGVK